MGSSILAMLWTAFDIYIHFVIGLLGWLYRGFMRIFMKKIEPAELSIPLLAARLSDLPYQAEDEAEIEAGVQSLLNNAVLLHFQDQELMGTNAVWFMCSGQLPGSESSSLFLVFRGTMSPTDAIADVLFRPESGPNGVQFHGGFLRTLQGDSELHAQIAKHVKGSVPLYIFGHSLGGALSTTLVGAGFIPHEFEGDITVVTLGGPATFYGEPDASALCAAAKRARVISVVNSFDVVPRLLGSPLQFVRRIIVLFAQNKNKKKQKINEALIDTLEQYTTYPQLELIYVHAGVAKSVPRKDRLMVLHLADAISPRAISAHLCYVDAVEAAASAPHWIPPHLKQL